MERLNHNLYARIAAVAAERAAAVCWESPGRSTLSYGQLHTQVLRYAGALRALGVAPGDRVLAQIDKSIEALLLYLGTLASGAVFVPVNSAYTAAEVAYFIADAEPRLFVCDPAREGEFGGAVGDATPLTTLDGAGGGRLPQQVEAATPAALAERGGSDLAAIVYTSGTTGRPKGAMLSHGNLESNAKALVALWRFTATDVLLHALPVFHIHGLFVATHCALFAGARTLLLPRFDATDVIGLLPRSTVFMGVPTYYTRLLADPRLTRASVAGLRLFVCGSAPLLASTFEAFAQHTGQQILERYGMSEAGMIASNPYAGPRLAGSVGYPLPGLEARVVDEPGQELPRGSVGVLEIRGPGVFSGYWRKPEQTAAQFRADGFFITGDLAEMQPDGRLAIVGRAKDLIISGGYNIDPREIELALEAHSEVAESAVIGVPHADFGEALVAVVVPVTGSAPTEVALLESLQGRLARFKQPKRVIFVGALPRNALGKLQKARLRDEYARLFQPLS